MIVSVKIEKNKITLIDKENDSFSFKKNEKEESIFGRTTYSFLKPIKKITKNEFILDMKELNYNKGKEEEVNSFIDITKNTFENYDYIIDLDNLFLFKENDNKLDYTNLFSLKEEYIILKEMLRKVRPEHRSKLENYQNNEILNKEDLNEISKVVLFNYSELLSSLKGKRILIASFVKDEKFLEVFLLLSKLILDFDCFLFIN